VYYGFAQFLPLSYRPGVGRASKRIRASVARRLLKSAGDNINIEARVDFGDGSHVSVGSCSGIGARSRVEAAVIEDGVMIGPELLVLSRNHTFSDPDQWVGRQGVTERMPIHIGEGSWIGARVTILPGIHIGRQCVVGAGSVVTRDVEDFSVVAGNPARLIRRWGQQANDEEVPGRANAGTDIDQSGDTDMGGTTHGN
jgi:maltose O-acetyltransferase